MVRESQLEKERTLRFQTYFCMAGIVWGLVNKSLCNMAHIEKKVQGFKVSSEKQSHTSQHFVVHTIVVMWGLVDKLF